MAAALQPQHESCNSGLGPAARVLFGSRPRLPNIDGLKIVHDMNEMSILASNSIMNSMKRPGPNGIQAAHDNERHVDNALGLDNELEEEPGPMENGANPTMNGKWSPVMKRSCSLDDEREFDGLGPQENLNMHVLRLVCSKENLTINVHPVVVESNQGKGLEIVVEMRRARPPRLASRAGGSLQGGPTPRRQRSNKGVNAEAKNLSTKE